MKFHFDCLNASNCRLAKPQFWFSLKHTRANYTSYWPSARSVWQVMDQVFPFLLWKQGRKKRGSITCHTDRANQANKMFIIWLCWLFRFWKGDREPEVRTATYGPGIDQSQHAKSVSHIIKFHIELVEGRLPILIPHPQNILASNWIFT